MKVNCAALPPELLESELFGYEAGAFTGAVRSKPGKFELCEKGAIFLDEIGEMSPALQAKLLHVLQDGQYSRLGGRIDLVTDVRVFAATNIRMQEAIKNKTFREDLYYRLNAFTVTVPPLRDRREEIPALFQDFMKRYSDQYCQPPLEYSAVLAAACMQYHWPGNIRELENLIKRYVILRDEAAVVSELLTRSRINIAPICRLPSAPAQLKKA
jgi:transcriptional regulator with PAS, ATPase and Fis domain